MTSTIYHSLGIKSSAAAGGGGKLTWDFKGVPEKRVGAWLYVRGIQLRVSAFFTTTAGFGGLNAYALYRTMTEINLTLRECEGKRRFSGKTLAAWLAYTSGRDLPASSVSGVDLAAGVNTNVERRWYTYLPFRDERFIAPRDFAKLTGEFQGSELFITQSADSELDANLDYGAGGFNVEAVLELEARPDFIISSPDEIDFTPAESAARGTLPAGSYTDTILFDPGTGGTKVDHTTGYTAITLTDEACSIQAIDSDRIYHQYLQRYAHQGEDYRSRVIQWRNTFAVDYVPILAPSAFPAKMSDLRRLPQGLEYKMAGPTTAPQILFRRVEDSAPESIARTVKKAAVNNGVAVTSDDIRVTPRLTKKNVPNPETWKDMPMLRRLPKKVHNLSGRVRF